MMNARPLLALGTGFLLAACGTLKMDIVYDTTPSFADTETRPVPMETKPLTNTETSAPTDRTPSFAKSSPTVSAPSTPAETATAIAAGYNHTCALLNSGRVQCWGLNDMGQIGDGSTTDAFLPVDVLGLEGRK
jgi:Regulator of chromosome condensation (RCC1) repeat.